MANVLKLQDREHFYIVETVFALNLVTWGLCTFSVVWCVCACLSLCVSVCVFVCACVFMCLCVNVIHMTCCNLCWKHKSSVKFSYEPLVNEMDICRSCIAQQYPRQQLTYKHSNDHNLPRSHHTPLHLTSSRLVLCYASFAILFFRMHTGNRGSSAL